MLFSILNLTRHYYPPQFIPSVYVAKSSIQLSPVSAVSFERRRRHRFQLRRSLDVFSSESDPLNGASVVVDAHQNGSPILRFLPGAVIVIMGVSGAGKTTIGRMLEKEIGYKYLDADDFHSQSNKEKMRMGIPLTDEDRTPWLESLRDAIKESLLNKKGMILGCSALKKQYREILRSGDPNYKLGSYASAVNFILLDAPAEVLSARLNKRAAEGKHYMPASLLQSQLDLLKIDESEGIFRVDATLSPESIVNTISYMHQCEGCFQS